MREMVGGNMKKTRIYSYAKCSTCRKALQFLTKKGIPHEVVDITETPPTPAELRQMLKVYQGELRKLFNTSGIQYRELGLSEKLKTMSEAQALQLLSSNGKLVKRPFALQNDAGLVGFDEKAWSEFFA